MDGFDLKRLLDTAYRNAISSPDPSNQNGALIVDYNETVLVADCNRFPPGFELEPHQYMETGSTKDLPATDLKKNKYMHIEHAERMVCHLSPRRDKNHAMICPWATCHECGRAIVMSGVKYLVVHKERIEQTAERWRPDVEAANRKVEAGGVKIITVDGPVDTPAIIQVDGRPWSPKDLCFTD